VKQKPTVCYSDASNLTTYSYSCRRRSHISEILQGTASSIEQHAGVAADDDT
jgi:hypothetical protein